MDKIKVQNKKEVTMPKETPILFSTEMVQAILAGKKTQTRRVVKAKTGECLFCGCTDEDCTDCIRKTGSPCYWIDDRHTQCSACENAQLPKEQKYHVGDLLWVRETFCRLVPKHILIGKRFVYKADACADSEDTRKDYLKAGYPYKWKPSIHMPKEAARIWLEITNVRVERLNDISEEDAVAEGVTPAIRRNFGYSCEESIESFYMNQATHTFKLLWESINGEGSWEKNPWVWDVEFVRVEKGGERCSDM